METSPKSVEREWREDDLKEKDEDEEPRDAFEVNGNAREDNTNVWTDDAESTHTAFKEDVITSKFEDDGDWAPNLFYAYARRVSKISQVRTWCMLKRMNRQMILASLASSSLSPLLAYALNGGHCYSSTSAARLRMPGKDHNSFPSQATIYLAGHGSTRHFHTCVRNGCTANWAMQ